MPFGPYKDFADCKRKNQGKVSDVDAFCGWLKHKIEGQDPIFMQFIGQPELLLGFYRLEFLATNLLDLKLIDKEKAEAALSGKDVWKKDPDAVVLDDHRWMHMWEKTLSRGNDLFLSKAQLKKLHDMIVAEMAERRLDSGLNHKTPINVSVLKFGGGLEQFLKDRKSFLMDPNFISLIGNAVLGKESTNLELMFNSARNEDYQIKLLETVSEGQKESINFIWGTRGPNGPFIPAYELWAVPVDKPLPLEPKYNISPMAPIKPAQPRHTIDDPRSLLEDGYHVTKIGGLGLRAMMHRKESQIIAFGEDLEEIDLPDSIVEAALDIGDPKTFVLDGYITKTEEGYVYYLLDFLWGHESEYISQTMQERHSVMSRIQSSDAIQLAPSLYFDNRKKTIDFLKMEEGPCLLVPNSSEYPVTGSADWYMYNRGSDLKLDGISSPILLQESSLPNKVTFNVLELSAFLKSQRSSEVCMKLSCGACVPLKKTLMLQNSYMIYPEKAMRWVLQLHVNGLSVHGDLRMMINKSQAIGWTLDAGKSLAKVLLKRFSPELQASVGITEEDMKLPLKAFSKKLNSSKMRKLKKALTKKAQELPFSQIKALCHDLWADEIEPLLGDPSKNFLTTQSSAMSAEWLDYEQEIPAGAVGTTKELGGQLVILDTGTVEWGAQKSYFHEYFLQGEKIGKKRLVVRRIPTQKLGVEEAFAWLSFFTKQEDLPYTLSERAIDQDWMPPEGVSALPKSLRDQIPLSWRYWRVKNAMELRNSLVKNELMRQPLKMGKYLFVKSVDGWIFQKMGALEKSLHLSAGRRVIMCGTNDDVKIEQRGDLLILTGPAIKPGEVIPMDGKPSFFTKRGIKSFWPSMFRQPVVVMHGPLKGDVVGFVNKRWYDDETGWGWVEAVIWHPLAMQLILDKKLSAFSIEVLPETVWDPEHQHDHIIGGVCEGLSVVPKGACPTCTPVDARMGTISELDGQVYKFGMTIPQFLEDRYYKLRMSTQEISDEMGIPRSTIENWMNRYDLPRRGTLEARRLRASKELGLGGEIVILGSGGDLPQDGCAQCREAEAGGKSRRNSTSTLLSVGDQHLLVDAPKGILDMVGARGAKPKYVLIEHAHEDVVGGLHELRALKPNVFATKEVWAFIRRNYRALSGQKGRFEEIYNFNRYVIASGQPFKMGTFTVTPTPVGPSKLGFKMELGGKTVWHGSSVPSIPKQEALKGVDIYIGDGASLSGEKGHASMAEQIRWAQKAGVQKIFFTQIGHLEKSHEEIDEELEKLAPNAVACFDGDEISLGGSNPLAVFPEQLVDGLLSGDVDVIVRMKPYSEYAKQAILLGNESQVYALYVEGFPEKVAAKDAKDLKHGLSDKEWKALVGDQETVWLYHPRILKRFEPAREMREGKVAGPYIHDAEMTSDS